MDLIGQTKDLWWEERRSDSPFVEAVWRSSSDRQQAFLSIAQTQPGLVITKLPQGTTVTLRGPETMATFAETPPEAEFVGVLFRPGTLITKFPPGRLMDRNDIHLPNGTGQTFWLNSALWQYPDYDNVDVFVNWLAQDGLLYHDPLIEDVLNGNILDLSVRSVQRRFKAATGLTYGQFDQIQRARHATFLLQQGVSPLDVAWQAGYADHPHLIRSLKRFIGLTPQQLTTPNRELPLSFLFNTPLGVLP
jgi:AraC-like DNA-binding protein